MIGIQPPPFLVCSLSLNPDQRSRQWSSLLLSFEMVQYTITREAKSIVVSLLLLVSPMSTHFLSQPSIQLRKQNLLLNKSTHRSLAICKTCLCSCFQFLDQCFRQVHSKSEEFPDVHSHSVDASKWITIRWCALLSSPHCDLAVRKMWSLHLITLPYCVNWTIWTQYSRFTDSGDGQPFLTMRRAQFWDSGQLYRKLSNSMQSWVW